MPVDPRKHQKKQERRRARNKAKHQQLVKAKNAGLAERLAANASAPFFHNWATESIWTDGIGQVCLSRSLPGGQVAFAMFLVDRYCLGVKDAWADIRNRSDYESHIERGARGRLAVRDLTPADVRKLIEGAVAYAEEPWATPALRLSEGQASLRRHRSRGQHDAVRVRQGRQTVFRWRPP